MCRTQCGREAKLATCAHATLHVLFVAQTSVKMKLLVGAVIKDICGTPLDVRRCNSW